MGERDRRALMWGGTLIVIAWLALRGGPQLFRGVAQMEEEVAQTGLYLSRVEDRLARSSSLGDSIAVLEASAELLPTALLAGEDALTAATDLMARVRERLGTEDVRILDFGAPTTVGRSGALALVMLTVRVETDFRTVIDRLRLIETATDMGVQAVHLVASNSEEVDQPERIEATLEVVGWFRLPAVADSAAPGITS
ncbi:MAG: hypothetical protein AAF389_20650 [Gemmatimonadota bacterium]